MRAAILSFSLRNGGNCESLSSYISGLLEGSFDITTFDRPRITPCGNCGYVCFRNQRCPFSQDDACRMYEAVCESDVAVYIVPNYCDYPNACFFAFNERGQYFFQGHDEKYEKYMRRKKLFLVISNTGKENFEKAFSYHVPAEEKQNMLILSARKYGKSSIDGNLMEVREARDAVKEFVKSVL